MLRFLKRWRKAKVRVIAWRDWYIRWTPNFGIGTPWPKSKNPSRMRRLRLAWHHGVQIITWRGARWVVTQQLLGTSKVNKESFDLKQR